MKIEIESKRTQDGADYFEWDLLDGPDGIDHAHGYATDLITAFSKLIEWRERIAADYTQDTEPQINETDCRPTE
jgi:hypothetical protein